jgi:hypothetical protein
LIQIREFLDTNPREVVTIIFEDYLRNPTIMKRVFDQSRVSGHVLKSDHWGSRYREWPTLVEMRTLGRLVVFNNNGLEGFPYTVNNMWYYVRENRYGQPGLDTKVLGGYHEKLLTILTQTTDPGGNAKGLPLLSRGIFLKIPL